MPAPVNPNRSLLDATQILQRVMDESTDKIRVDSSVSITEIQGDVSVELSAADGDSVAISDGVNNVTTTVIGPDVGLDVNVLNLPQPVSTPLISNVSLATGGTEYSITLLSNVKRYRLKLRDDARLKIAFGAGQTNTNYITIPMGCEYNEENITLSSNLTIYVQASKNSQVLEVLSWS
jgi:hypothetical protein